MSVTCPSGTALSLGTAPSPYTNDCSGAKYGTTADVSPSALLTASSSYSVAAIYFGSHT